MRVMALISVGSKGLSKPSSTSKSHARPSRPLIGAAVVIGCAGQGAFAADDEDEEKPLVDTTIVRHILPGPRLEARRSRRHQLSRTFAAGGAGRHSNCRHRKPAGRRKRPNLAERSGRLERRGRASRDSGKPARTTPHRRHATAAAERCSAGACTTTAPHRRQSAADQRRERAPAPRRSLAPKNSGAVGLRQQRRIHNVHRRAARASLTEPPPGYHTPSTAQPYGIGNADACSIDQRDPVGSLPGKAPCQKTEDPSVFGGDVAHVFAWRDVVRSMITHSNPAGFVTLH